MKCNFRNITLGLAISLICGTHASGQKADNDYKIRVADFASSNAAAFLKNTDPGTKQYEIIFGPCKNNSGGGMDSVQIYFNNLFIPWIKDIFENTFPDLDKLYNYFGKVGKTKLQIFQDIVSEILSGKNTRSYINSRLSEICAATPPPATTITENEPPTADAGPDQSITLQANEEITLSGKGTDPDGTIIAYHWTVISGPSKCRIESPAQAETKVSNLVPGVYTFLLTVYDNDKTAASDAVSITIRSAPSVKNLPPFADAGPDQSIRLPENSVILTGNGSDKDGRIVAYHWRIIAGPTEPAISVLSPTDIRVNNLSAGDYTAELEVTDDKGATATDTMLIVVDHAKKNGYLLPLVIALIAGLGAISFFILIPKWKTRKVVVYFMHEDERLLVNKLMPLSEKTDGYAVGNCSEGKIKRMTKRGLSIHLLNTNLLIINTPGLTRAISFSFRKGISKVKTITRNSKNQNGNFINILSGDSPVIENNFPSFYIIALDGPLLPLYRERLTGIEIDILQYIPDNSYVILIRSKEQINQIKKDPSFKFVRMIDQYSAQDTGFIVRKDHYRDARQSPVPKKLILDLVLHRREDADVVFNFLKQNNIEIISFYITTIRISLAAGSPMEYELSANQFVQAIYEYVPPVLYNDIARELIGIDSENKNSITIEENGDGEIVAVADTGIDLDHPDLRNRISGTAAWGRMNTRDISDPDGHGTHVAGTIAGDGTSSNGQIKGIATGSKLFFQSIMNDEGTLSVVDTRLTDLFMEAYVQGARIHNNSWGAATEARYTFDSSVVDQFIFEHPEMLIVIAAGNDGICETRWENEKGYIGLGSIGSPATNKNGITVGASRSKRTIGGYASSTYGKVWQNKFMDPPTSLEKVSGDANCLGAFSSRGPCDDDRMKPDIVAPGTDILSTKSNLAPLHNFHGGYTNNAYAFISGTSMAAPMVSGAAAIIREYYRKKRVYPKPSAALIKATLINGTKKLTGFDALHGSDIIPNFNQGFGMLDMLYTIPNNHNNFRLEFRDSLNDPSLVLNQTGQTFTLQLTTNERSWIHICMTYTDHPARAIQNDLDLLVDYDARPRKKWNGNTGVNAMKPYPREEDRTNNTEIVRIEEAEAGLYTIKVIAYNLTKGPQGFALVVTTGDLSAKFM